jgi:HlyD family secretion protein
VKLFPLFLCLTVVGFLAAEDTAKTWTPREHPATSERVMTGFTKPRRQLDLAAEIPGRVQIIRVEVGDYITASEPVVQLDATQAEFALAQAKAGVVAAEEALKYGELSVQAAQHEADLRARTAARVKKLQDEGKLSLEELDNTTTAAEIARVAVEQARAMVAQKTNALAQARIEAERSADQIKRHALSAPLGWRVAMRVQEPGSMVAPGTPILRLVDVETLTIEFYVTAQEWLALQKIGLPELMFPRHNNLRVKAIALRFDPQFDVQTRKNRLEIDVPSKDLAQQIGGLEAQLSFTMPDNSGAVVIPLSFVHVVADRSHVRLSDGRDVPITVLRRMDNDHIVVMGDALSTSTLIHPARAAGQ